MKGCILYVNPERLYTSGTMFTCYFVDPDLRLEIFFEKKRG